jgi:hypothetical protein
MHQLETGPDNLVELRVRGRLEADDYDAFVPRIEQAIEDHGKIRLLVELGDMAHVTPGAVWEDLKFSSQVLGDIERAALVGDAAWQDWAARLSDPIVHGDVEFFDEAHADDARRWIQEGLD